MHRHRTGLFRRYLMMQLRKDNNVITISFIFPSRAAVFVAGSFMYKKNPPQGNIMLKVCNCIGVRHPGHPLWVIQFHIEECLRFGACAFWEGEKRARKEGKRSSS